MGAPGCPKGRMAPCERVDELAPGQRKHRGPSPKRDPVPVGKRVRVVAGLGARAGPAAGVADRHGVSRAAPHVWRGEAMGDDCGGTGEKGVPASRESDDPPDDIGGLQDMPREAKTRLGEAQLELDVRQAALETAKRGPGADPGRPANAERAAMVAALGAKHRLRELPPAVGMAKSSYEHAASAQMGGEAEGHAAAREAVTGAFEASGGTCGCRRITAVADAGERAARATMREGEPVACAARGRRRCGPYEGEAPAAPPNLLRGGRGRHHLRADKPDDPWMADATESHVPAGRACLPPVVDRLGGMPPGRSASTSPDAETASSSLPGACGWPNEGGRPGAHPDGGGHCRWPGWARTCDENGLVRSMPRKGCGPDDARCEGFFGRLKIGFLHGCDWAGATVEEFMGMLDAYLRWYRDVRVKSDLGYRSPMQYRRDLGLAA